MARYKDVDGYRKLFDEEYKKTRELIFEGEIHLDNLAEGFSEASRVIDSIPTADVVPKSEYDAVVSAVDNSTKEFLKLHDDYQEAKREIDKWMGRCREWHEAAELKQQRIAELEAEVERLEGELIVESTRRKNAVDAYHEARQKVAREIFEEIEQKNKDEMELNNKAMVNCFHNEEWRNRSSSRNTALREIYVFISALKKKYDKDCRDCRYFVGCETACGGRPCDEFEAKKEV